MEESPIKTGRDGKFYGPNFDGEHPTPKVELCDVMELSKAEGQTAKQWTSEVPVEDGWYWLDDHTRYGKELVKFTKHYIERIGIVMEDYAEDLPYGCKWYGPLKPPE